MTIFSFFAKKQQINTPGRQNQFLQFKPPWTLLSPVYNRMMCALTDGGILAIGSYKPILVIGSRAPFSTSQIKAHKYRPIDRGLTLHFHHCGLNKAHYSNPQHCHSCFFDLTRPPNSVRTSAVMCSY